MLVESVRRNFIRCAYYLLNLIEYANIFWVFDEDKEINPKKLFMKKRRKGSIVCTVFFLFILSFVHSSEKQRIFDDHNQTTLNTQCSVLGAETFRWPFRISRISTIVWNVNDPFIHYAVPGIMEYGISLLTHQSYASNSHFNQTL